MVPNALTIDVEEWFHICGAGPELSPSNWPRLPSRVVQNTDRLLDILDHLQIRATFFVLGYIAERHPDLVVRIAQAGHEIGSHGSRHQRVYELSPEAFGRDVDDGFGALAACGIEAAPLYRAPEWSINDRSLWALDVLAERGLRIDSSMAPLRRVGRPGYPQSIHLRRTSHGPLIECPPAVERRFGQHVPFGGGWGLRMSRPSRVLRRLEARNRRGESAVFWLHPWELDDNPPRVWLPWPLWVAHYFRLSGFDARLEEVLRGAGFGPLSGVAGRCLATC
jgi:polysaccharide deacetylase family protein (PEP-CTERM system associated)